MLLGSDANTAKKPSSNPSAAEILARNFYGKASRYREDYLLARNPLSLRHAIDRVLPDNWDFACMQLEDKLENLDIKIQKVEHVSVKQLADLALKVIDSFNDFSANGFADVVRFIRYSLLIFYVDALKAQNDNLPILRKNLDILTADLTHAKASHAQLQINLKSQKLAFASLLLRIGNIPRTSTSFAKDLKLLVETYRENSQKFSLPAETGLSTAAENIESAAGTANGSVPEPIVEITSSSATENTNSAESKKEGNSTASEKQPAKQDQSAKQDQPVAPAWARAFLAKLQANQKHFQKTWVPKWVPNWVSDHSEWDIQCEALQTAIENFDKLVFPSKNEEKPVSQPANKEKLEPQPTYEEKLSKQAFVVVAELQRFVNADVDDNVMFHIVTTLRYFISQYPVFNMAQKLENAILHHSHYIEQVKELNLALRAEMKSEEMKYEIPRKTFLLAVDNLLNQALQLENTNTQPTVKPEVLHNAVIVLIQKYREAELDLDKANLAAMKADVVALESVSAAEQRLAELLPTQRTQTTKNSSNYSASMYSSKQEKNNEPEKDKGTCASESDQNSHLSNLCSNKKKVQ